MNHYDQDAGSRVARSAPEELPLLVWRDVVDDIEAAYLADEATARAASWRGPDEQADTLGVNHA